MTDHDIERIDKAIEQLASRLSRLDDLDHEKQLAIYRLEDKVKQLEDEVVHLKVEIRR